MSITSSFGSLITKKRVSILTLSVFVSHIFSPFFAYAMSGDPTWSENILSTEAPAIIQLNSVPLPRTLEVGDTITLNLSGSVVANPSAVFITDEDTTLANLVTAVNAVATGSIIASVQTGTGKSIVINASIPGVIVGTLTIDRNLTERNIRNAVTAVAQQALVSLPQQLFASDTISVTLAGSGTPGGVGLTQAFTGDSATTRVALVSQIDALSFVDATMTGATDIIITSSFSGTPFSLSNVFVTSSSLPVVPEVTNVSAQAQKEIYNLARPTYSDETLTAHIAGFTLTGSDLSTLSSRINTDLAGIVTTTLSGANSLDITAVVPGTPFATGNLNIAGGTALVVPLIANRVAVAQVDQVILSRSLVAGDTVYTTVSVPSVSLSRVFASATLTGLSANISSDPQVGLYVSGSVSGNTLTLTALHPGTAFSTATAHIDSLIHSVNVNPNVPAVSKVDSLTFPRSLVAGDSVSLTINGNTVVSSFSGSSATTLTTLAASISAATVGVSALSSGLDILVSSTVPGQDFSLSSVTLENSKQATVLVTPIVPVKQKNTYSFNAQELAGDVFSVSVNSTSITGSTLSGVVDAINMANLGVDASLVGQSIEMLAHTGGIAFTASDMTLVSRDFTGSSTSGASEFRAMVSVDLNLLPIDGESLTIGNCTIGFNTGTVMDTDCTDSIAAIDVTGQSSLEFLASGIRGITGITYDDGVSTGVTLVSGGTGTGMTFTRGSTQVWVLTIPLVITGAFGNGSTSTPTVGTTQVDTITLPRSLTSGDTLSLSISGQLVNQNIGTSTGADFDNFVSTLNLLENISVVRSGDTLTLTAKTPGTPFILDFGRLTHLTQSILSVSNDIGRVESQSLNFPAYIINGEGLSFGIDGTYLTGTFNTDVATTFASIIATSPITGITFSASGSDLIITSTVPGVLFQVNPLSITSGFAPATLTGNTVAGYQKDTLTLPFDPISGDVISVTVIGTTESGTFTRTYSGDLATTMGLLTSDISTLTGTVSASLDGTSKVITLDAVTAGNSFTATFNIGGATIAPTTLVDNTGSQAQIDQIVLGRTIAMGDTLSLTVNTGSFSRTFATDSDTTMNALASDISASLSGVVSAGYAGGVLTFTSLIPGTPFTTSSLTIATTIPSTSIQPNIVPVAQKDFIDFERDPMAGDVFSLDFSGSMIQVLSGSTLTGLVNSANLSLTGVALLSMSGTHALEVLSSVPGAPFTLSNAVRANSPVYSGSYTPNVVSVFPIREIDFPIATAGDIITVTVNNGSTFTATGSDITSLLSSLNTSGIVTATLSGSNTLSLLGTLDIPFTITTANVTNSTTVTLNQAYVAPISRSVEIVPEVTAPATTLNSGWTMNVTFNGANFSYLTNSGDTLDTVVNALYAQIALTGSSAGTGITLLPSASGGVLVSTGISSTGSTIGLPMIAAVSEVPGVGFTESFSVVDITSPILSSSLVQTPQTLRSGQTLSITGSVQADEPGSLYFVSSTLTITGAAQITTAVGAGQAFLGVTDMAGNVTLPSSLVVPALTTDGLYNIIAVDRANNLSMGMVGWLTVDNTAPSLTITTPDNQIVNQDTFTLSGTAEANVAIDITLGTGILNTVSLGDGSWSGTLNLPQNTGSVATVTATDAVGNTTVRTLGITEDSGIPPLSFSVSSLITNLPDVTLSGTTKSGATVIISGWSGMVLVVADGIGNFSASVPLTLDANNILVVDVVDQALNTNSGTVSVLQDSTAPTVVISTLSQTVHAASVTLDGMTENNSTLVVTNGGTVVGSGTASATGVLSIAGTLTINTANTLVVTATDAAGNTGSSSVVITEDSTPNTLVISTLPQTLNANSLTITGSTKPNSMIGISGGTVTATGVADGAGLYSLVVSLTQDAPNMLVVTSTDVVLNVLTGLVLIVEDSTAPVTVIGTPSQTTYNPIITLTGTTEALATVVITGGSGTTSTVADGSGVWTLPVPLNLSSVNTLVATATDLAGNTGSASVAITHDSVTIFLTMSVPDQTVHATTFTFTGTTKSGATIMITSGTGVSIITTPASGDFTGTVNLVPDTANLVSVSAQDATLTTATGSFTITEDSTAPVLVFSSPSGTTTALANAILVGTTETGATISVNNSGTITSGSASGTGSFSITVPLYSNVLNTLNVTATDAVGNTGTGTWTIVQDSTGPIISGFSVTPTLVGPNMIANYVFTTNENSTGVLSIGTGANVLATLVASGTTSGTTHTSMIPGLLANTDYYYTLTTTDSVGNSTTTTVGVINSMDTLPPTIQSATLSHLTTTGATLDYTFTEANFNTLYATGSVTITTSTGVTIGTYPSTFLTGVVSVGTSLLSGLTSATAYVYTIQLADTFGNLSVASGTFTTPTVVPLIGGTVTATGSVQIGTGGSGTTALSGTTVIVISNPNNIGSLTGSLTLSGVTSIVSGSGWNGVLLSPVLVPSNLPQSATAGELNALITALNTTTTTYSLWQIFQTVEVGAGNTSIIAVGGSFQVSFIVPGAAVGQTLRVYQSIDGNTWQNNTPDTTCTIDVQNMCTFQATKLGYFSVASIIGTPIPPVSSGGGGGGGSLSRDTCPMGDYSNSYYDGTCGVKPVTSVTSPTTTTGSGKQNVTFTSNIDSIIATDGTISQEKFEQFIADIQYRVYTRTLNNSSRIMSFTTMNRYIDTQIGLTESTTKKTILTALKNRFNRIIMSLRQDIANGVTMIPNRKKNNTSSDTMANVVGSARIYRYVNTENILAVRSAPNFKSDISGYLLMNERVEVLAGGPNWSQVKANTIEGYVRTRLLRKTLEMRNRDASLVYASVSGGERGVNEGRDME